jgi:hypothetical protein
MYFKLCKNENYCQSRLFYPAKLSIINEKEKNQSIINKNKRILWPLSHYCIRYSKKRWLKATMKIWGNMYIYIYISPDEYISKLEIGKNQML